MDKIKSFERTNIGPGKILFDEGDKGDAAYLIMKGQVEIRRGVRSSYPKVVSTLGPGDICGEMALFDDRPRMASAVTTTECELVAVPREDFVKRLEEMNPVMRRILVIMVGRVRSMTDEFMKRKAQKSYADVFRAEEGSGEATNGAASAEKAVSEDAVKSGTTKPA
ncbi:MAG: cyclic nucleotide-binding domain-containing protein [Alphaproteobacteria bacterium]|nr:cyclic nucleotide-binding domain-containing protein [Alphaproteobacteria bacterium]